MGRPSHAQNYLLQGDSTEQLRLLDAFYGEWRDGRPMIMGKRTPARYWPGIWGRTGSEGQSLVNIGLRGRLWVLALLLVHYGDATPSPDKIARAVVQPWKTIGPERAKFEAAARPHEKERASDYLNNLISATFHGRHRPPELVEGLLEMMISHCQNRWFATEPAGAEHEAQRAEFFSVATSRTDRLSVLYRRLEEIVARVAERTNAIPSIPAGSLPVSNDARRSDAVRPSGEVIDRLTYLDLLSHIDDELAADVVEEGFAGRAMVPATSQDFGDVTVRGLSLALQLKPRLHVLGGEPLLGKKTTIKSLLRLLGGRHNKLLFELDELTTGQIQLPIAAFSANGVHYRGLVNKVIAFLRRYQVGLHRAGIDRAVAHSDPLPPNALFDEIVEDIYRDFQGLPALFIFTDVEGLEKDRMRHAVLDQGIWRLIEALRAADPRTRIIITTTGELADEDKKIVSFGSHIAHAHRVDAPRLADLRHFMNSESFARIPPDSFLRRRPPTELRGDDMIALATLLGLRYAPNDGPGLNGDDVAVIDAFLSRPRDDRDAVRPALYRLLAEQLRVQGILHAVVLVAASEDGVREDSLTRLMQRWAPYDVHANALHADPKAMFERLARIRDLSDNRFLKHGPLVRHDPDEYPAGAKTSRHDPAWRIDPRVAYSLLEALREQDGPVVSQAHRLIAWIARERAQHKRVLMRTAFGSRATEDASRDIQTYVGLLASVNTKPAPFPAPTAPNLPLRLREDEIFALDDRFNTVAAVRFAALGLLREDIDRDYRLSMIFDEDSLRLDLYLLLFQTPGRWYPTHVAPLTVPAEMPDHLLLALQSEELFALMTTVALAAFHAQRSDVITAIVQLAENFESDCSPAVRIAHLSRIWCCQIDDRIMLGGKPSLHDALGDVQKLLQEEFPALDAARASADRQTVEAMMRIVAREAEICALVSEDRAVAAKLYLDIESCEKWLGAGRADQLDPAVLNGRLGRRYIRFLMHEEYFAQLDPGERQRALDTVRTLLDVNTARLRRFGGADRVGVMLDLAKYHKLLGELTPARAYATLAHHRAASGSASHGTKLDVLATLADINTLFAETELASEIPDIVAAAAALHIATIGARDLGTIATQLGAIPAQAQADYIQARVMTCEAAHGADPLIGGWDAAKPPPDRRTFVHDRLVGAQERLSQAIDRMASIGDVSHRTRFALLQSRIDELHELTGSNL